MGLFSRKPKITHTDIPQDILDTVSVNGQMQTRKHLFTQEASTGSNTSQDTGASTPSPFLNPSASSDNPSPAQPMVTAQPVQTTGISPNDDKAQEAPSAQAIHFTDVPDPVTSHAPERQESQKEVMPQNVRQSGQVISAVPSSLNTAPSITAPRQPDFSRITEEPAVKQAPQMIIPPKNNTARRAPSAVFSQLNTIVSIAIFFLILGLISGGSWYYLNTRQEVSVTALPQETNTTDTQTTNAETAGVVFNADQPQYLVIDVENVTATELKQLIAQKFQDLGTNQVTEPTEYLVVDQNNNPVAFSRFAYLVGASQPSDLVDAASEDFSLYLYLDKGAPHMALAVGTKASASESTSLAPAKVLTAFKGFLYPESAGTLVTGQETFGTSQYLGNTIFYANITPDQVYSFDTTQDQDEIVFANSKDTLRKTLDKRRSPATVEESSAQ